MHHGTQTSNRLAAAGFAVSGRYLGRPPGAGVRWQGDGQHRPQDGQEAGIPGVQAPRAIDTQEIAAKVKTAIFVEPGPKAQQISVDTVKARAALRGTPDFQASSSGAMTLVAAAPGAKAADNHLALTPSQ